MFRAIILEMIGPDGKIHFPKKKETYNIVPQDNLVSASGFTSVLQLSISITITKLLHLYKFAFPTM